MMGSFAPTIDLRLEESGGRLPYVLIPPSIRDKSRRRRDLTDKSCAAAR